MRHRRILVGRLVVGTLSLLCLANIAQAQPSAGQVLADAGLGADDQQSVLNGQFVTANVTTVSDRDLSFAIAFLVKEAPATLSKQIVAGDLITADAQVKAYGEIKGAGTLADFAKLTITSAEAQALTGAKAGEDVNLSARELAAFKALAGGTTQAVQQQLRRMLLARYQDYRASGLAGIPPYDRGGGRPSDPAGDLRKATEAARGLEKYMPAFQKLLLNYPQATLPGMQENFFWLRSLIEKKWTYILVHILSAPDGLARAVVRREYYASTGYNASQSYGGFLPVPEGTVVVTVSHAFTDQVTGFGGSMKRSIGSKVMASRMKEIYEAGREKVQK
jgi:hypothetical protein